MFKLVVLSALLAAAVAEPGVFYSSPLATTYAAFPPPVASTYVQHSSSYVAPSVYSDIAYPHLIKKRSPQFLTNYGAPYVAGAPLITPYASSYVAPSPITYSSPLLPHFIKKRSAPLIAAPASYIAGAPLASTYVASAPLATTYASGIIPSASYYSAYPGYVGGFPFIKK